eukprot:COSAG02_NODE_13433_length_1396_cov_0.919815_1_plen_68_part_00
MSLDAYSFHDVLNQKRVRGAKLFLATKQAELLTVALQLHGVDSGSLVELRHQMFAILSASKEHVDEQ